MKKYYIFLSVIITAAAAIAGVRFLSGEDNWICQNGEWIKHGNPETEKPIGNCGKSAENQKTNETIEEVKKAEANIIVSNPINNATVSSPFKVEGRARVFENVVSVKLKDNSGKVMIQGTTEAQSPDMGQYGPFSKEIQYETSETGGILEVFESSAKDGSEINKVTVSLKFGK